MREDGWWKGDRQEVERVGRSWARKELRKVTKCSKIATNPDP